MKIINDESLLKEYLQKYHILQNFKSENLHFELVSFEKGEYLSSPSKYLTHLLFVIKGQLSVFGIREDGTFFSINNEGKGSFLGDMEFSHNHSNTYFSESLETTQCIALHIENHRHILENDVLFLRFMLQHVMRRLDFVSHVELSSQSLESKLLLYLKEIEPNHQINGINPLLSKLHCSRRQLQRVIQKLCKNGQLVKTKKGNYELIC